MLSMRSNAKVARSMVLEGRCDYNSFRGRLFGLGFGRTGVLVLVGVLKVAGYPVVAIFFSFDFVAFFLLREEFRDVQSP